MDYSKLVKIGTKWSWTSYIVFLGTLQLGHALATGNDWFNTNVLAVGVVFLSIVNKINFIAHCSKISAISNAKLAHMNIVDLDKDDRVAYNDFGKSK